MFEIAFIVILLTPLLMDVKKWWSSTIPHRCRRGCESFGGAVSCRPFGAAVFWGAIPGFRFASPLSTDEDLSVGTPWLFSFGPFGAVPRGLPMRNHGAARGVCVAAGMGVDYAVSGDCVGFPAAGTAPVDEYCTTNQWHGSDMRMERVAG